MNERRVVIRYYDPQNGCAGIIGGEKIFGTIVVKDVEMSLEEARGVLRVQGEKVRITFGEPFISDPDRYPISSNIGCEHCRAGLEKRRQ